jgi:3-oxoacyl-[acyl-carrier-protein] synthase III
MMHKLADVTHDITAFFYGDGAGAAVVGAADKRFCVVLHQS